jgi:hypothetical protein
MEREVRPQSLQQVFAAPWDYPHPLDTCGLVIDRRQISRVR